MIQTFKKGWFGRKKTLIITSSMGMRNGRMHCGIDIKGSSGTKIYAPIGGVIILKKLQRGGAGLYIKLRYQYSASVYYDLIFMHLSKVIAKVGTKVEEGELLALSGGGVNDKPNCGRSTGAHLHFEIRKGAVAMNPFPFLSERCVASYNNRVLTSGRKSAMLPENVDDSEYNYKNIDVTSSSVANEIEFDIVPEDTTKKPNSVKERLALGIWQITKLLVDSSVSSRQIFDSSISFQTGQLGNFFSKVCQSPLVELSGDTYGDQYYFMLQKPPFDKEGLLRVSNATSLLIEENEIISTTISWDYENIYSWYQLIPFVELGYGADDLSLKVPAIFFPEYASVWGSKDLTIHDPYVSYYASGDKDTANNEEAANNGLNIIKNALRDLKYLVESNAYNPFVRSGTIVLNGDRRIKRGTIIIMPNREQFYVDSVSNSIAFSESSVDRTTTLTVSHGMFMEFIDGVKINDVVMSYFNLIDFGKDFNVEKIDSKEWRKAIANWKVNISVFAFFLKRSQILPSYAQKNS